MAVLASPKPPKNVFRAKVTVCNMRYQGTSHGPGVRTQFKPSREVRIPNWSVPLLAYSPTTKIPLP